MQITQLLSKKFPQAVLVLTLSALSWRDRDAYLSFRCVYILSSLLTSIQYDLRAYLRVVLLLYKLERRQHRPEYVFDSVTNLTVYRRPS